MSIAHAIIVRARRISLASISMFFRMLPDDPAYNRLRVWWLRQLGYQVGARCAIYSEVKITGKVSLGAHSAISNSCYLAGSTAGISVGDFTMIGPNTVVVAFNHGFERTDVPMRLQRNVSESVMIEDDVWIGANCTICAGVRIGKGSIIGAGAVVTKDIPAYSIAAGIPARVVGNRVPVTSPTLND